MNKRKSYLYVILAAVLWGVLGAFYRQLAALGFTSMEVVLMRISVATALLALVILFKDRRKFKLHIKDLWCPIGAGIITAIMFLSYFTALNYTTVAVAGVILYTAPGFVVVFSAILFKEKITVQKVVALLMLFGGCICSGGLFGGSQLVTLQGFFWSMISGLTYALYSIFNRFALNRGYGGLTVTFYTMLFGSLVTLLFVDLPVMAAKFTLSGILWGVGIGFFCCMLPYLVYTLGMKHIETGEAAMLATVEPVVAAIVSVTVLAEPMTAGLLAGIVLIVGGILFMNLSPGKILRRR